MIGWLQVITISINWLKKRKTLPFRQRRKQNLKKTTYHTPDQEIANFKNALLSVPVVWAHAQMHRRTSALVPSFKLTLWAFSSGELGTILSPYQKTKWDWSVYTTIKHCIL